ncbi:MAG: cation:dicarboxylase symporter family transporter, partial [Aureliella sp.]
MTTPTTQAAKARFWKYWAAIPLYWRILIGMLIGILAGLLLGDRAEWLRIPSGIILQLLSALAPPLILIAVIHVLMTSDIPRSSVARLAGLLLLNTTVAIFIGLTVANTLRPGKWSPAATEPAAVESSPLQTAEHDDAAELTAHPFDQLLGSLPRSLLGPLGDKQNVIGVIIIAIAFGVALRDVKAAPIT